MCIGFKHPLRQSRLLPPLRLTVVFFQGPFFVVGICPQGRFRVLPLLS